MRVKQFLSLGCGLLLSGITLAADFKLYTENFPPLNMTSNGSAYARNDRVSGFATDIVRELFSKTDLSVSYILKDWDSAYGDAQSTSETGVYSTFRTPEREDKFKWVGPLYNEDWVILARADTDVKVDTLKGLHNYKVGSHESDVVTDFLVEQGISIKPAKNDAVNVIRLKTGDIQLWAASSLTAPYIAANFKVPVKTVHTFNSSGLWLAMNKETDSEVIEQLNRTLQEMHKSGTVQKMIDSYNI
ncbi:amino acid ABC transporter substrate-binding protein [Endozoicomonas sp. OPT23]|nr:ABC transporter substrate-binding protein [Endozoicomonas sp. OPT23]MRI31843.1 amino acid ABC transporter substrate-binding protein [Endozoicomonas sp. OPT23]